MNQFPSPEQTSPIPGASAAVELKGLQRSTLLLGSGLAIMLTLMIAFGTWDVWPLATAGTQVQGTFLAFLLMDIFAIRAVLANRKQYHQDSVVHMILVIMALGVVVSLLMQGLGLVLGVIIFAVSVAVGARALPSHLADRMILLGTAFGGAAYVLDLVITWQRTPVSALTINILTWILGITLLFFVIFIVRVYAQLPMVSKVVLPFMLVSVISVAALSAYNASATRTALIESTNQKLRAAALLTAAQLDAFYTSEANAMLVERTLVDLTAYVDLAPDARAGSTQERRANVLLRSLQTRGFQARGFIQTYTLLDSEGNVLLDSRYITPETARQLPPYLEINLAQPDFFESFPMQDSVLVSPMMFDEIRQPVFYFSVQLISTAGDAVGYLVAGYNPARIQLEIIVPNNGLAGEGSFASVLSADGLRIANGLAPDALNVLITGKTAAEVQDLVDARRLPRLPYERLVSENQAFAAALQDAIRAAMPAVGEAGEAEQATAFFEVDEAGSPSLNSAAMVRAANLPWYITYLQPQTVLLAPVTEQVRLTTLLGLAVAAAMVLASLFIAQTLTSPIKILTDTAEEVASGNLQVRADVRTQDEIGVLAAVFNGMIGQLRGTLQGLEERVAERTAALAVTTAEAEQRAAQLEAIAGIARAIASERELDALLPLITQTISQQFGFYHVGIFLVDDRAEYAVLRAANSEGGQRMLARSHRLRVGQEGIIGYVTSRGEPRVALDVGKDAVFFNNPDLPATRSEMGLPLRSAGRVIGALDVQSTASGAFDEADVALLTILADQVSIAIENARLFTSTSQALTELQSIQRQYLRQQWQKQVSDTNRAGYTYDYGQLRPQAPGTAPLPEDPQRTLSAPISLRGEQIGAIELVDPDRQRTWTEEERSLAQAVAQQVGLALENARLLEETQRRAEREAMVAQITARLRASNDPQLILQTAARELREALQVSKAQILAPNKPGRQEE